jgi:hypothetical protein
MLPVQKTNIAFGFVDGCVSMVCGWCCTGGSVRSFSMIAGAPAFGPSPSKVNWDSFRNNDARPSRFVSKRL